MKTIIASIATALMMLMTFNSHAADNINPLKEHSTLNLLNVYLEATTLGSTDLNKYLFAEDFEYRNTANKDIFTKTQYTNYLKANKGLTYDCETTYEILDESGQACLAKATMTFKNFTRVDYITLTQTDDGWKVSKVVTTYP